MTTGSLSVSLRVSVDHFDLLIDVAEKGSGNFDLVNGPKYWIVRLENEISRTWAHSFTSPVNIARRNSCLQYWSPILKMARRMTSAGQGFSRCGCKAEASMVRRDDKPPSHWHRTFWHRPGNYRPALCATRDWKCRDAWQPPRQTCHFTCLISAKPTRAKAFTFFAPEVHSFHRLFFTCKSDRLSLRPRYCSTSNDSMCIRTGHPAHSPANSRSEPAGQRRRRNKCPFFYML